MEIHPALQEEYYDQKYNYVGRWTSFIAAILSIIAEVTLLILYETPVQAALLIAILPVSYAVLNAHYACMDQLSDAKRKMNECLRVPVNVISVILCIPLVYPIVPMLLILTLISGSDPVIIASDFCFFIIYLHIFSFMRLVGRDSSRYNQQQIKEQLLPQ